VFVNQVEELEPPPISDGVELEIHGPDLVQVLGLMTPPPMSFCHLSSCKAVWRSGSTVTTAASVVTQQSVTSARSLTNSCSSLPADSNPRGAETCPLNWGNPTPLAQDLEHQPAGAPERGSQAINRLVGAVLLEKEEHWQLEGRRMFSAESMAAIPALEAIQQQSALQEAAA
jgi:hypothetical protein